MATLIQIVDMQQNSDLVKQVTGACWKAAADIVYEAVNTENHAERLLWAKAIQSATAPALITRMLNAACQNATLQSSAPAGPWVDGDVQFVVNSAIDSQVMQ